ncbi:unnamed protein product, partial [Rotaria sp. Silwood1]
MDETNKQQMKNIRTAVENLQICNHQEEPPGLADVYGFIKFSGEKCGTTTRHSQYIRLSVATKAETIVKFMYNGWNLPKPDIIISITGGAKNDGMPEQVRKIFQMGLVSAASRANAWLITSGTNAGVVEKVGEAINYCRYNNRKNALDIPCIGIASWGYIAENEQLDNKPIRSLVNVTNTRSIRSFSKRFQHQAIEYISMDNDDRNYIRDYNVKSNKQGECYLEPNHTHFLLIDDGQKNANTVFQLRAAIEKCSRNANLANTANDAVKSLIPIVMVLVEGGTSAILTICEALKCDTPVVVIKNSGRAADLVAKLHACLSDGEIGNDGVGSAHSTRSQTGIARNLQEKIDKIMNEAQIEGFHNVKNDLRETLYKCKHLITIFDFDSKRHRGNFEDVFLESLLKARRNLGTSNEQHSLARELILAIVWHKFNYAEKYHLTDTTISKWASNEDDRRRALVEALYHGQTDWVKLLIELGISLENLTKADLERLYKKSTSNQLPIENAETNIKSIKLRYYSYYFHWNDGNTNNSNDSQQLNDSTRLGESAPLDLFLWAVFFDRFELAIYLCSRIWNIPLALLFGAHIYRRAAKIRQPKDTDIQKQCNKHADQFDTGAASIIKLCFDDDEQFALDLLQRSDITFKNLTPLELAKDAECKSFLASKCVQRHLDNIWYGCINHKREAINFKIFFIIFLGLFSFVLLVDYFPLNIYNESRSGYENLLIPITEIILHVCVWSLIVEEIYQILSAQSSK